MISIWNQGTVILCAYNSYKGSVIDFCKANSITKSQFYYYKRRFKKVGKPVFHAIALNKEDTNAVCKIQIKLLQNNYKQQVKN